MDNKNIEKNLFSKNETLRIKGVAILLLLFHHLFYSPKHIAASGIQLMIVPVDILQPIAVMARICVWIFAFLSAYGLSCQYMESKYNNIQFVIKRWISLLSTFWIPYFIVFITYGIVVGNPMLVYENSWCKAVLDFIGCADFFGTPMILGAYWYICFALILILLIPFFNFICKIGGGYSFVLTFFIMQYMSDGIVSPFGGKYINYFLAIMLAVLCANYRLFDKILVKKNSKIFCIFECLILTIISLILIYINYKLTGIDIWNIRGLIYSITVLVLCVLISKYYKFRWLTPILTFLGIHSGNIFMVHVFFYTYMPRLVYWSKNAFVSYCCLLLLSVITSIFIETIKKVIHYNIFVQNLTQRFLTMTKLLQ